MEQLLLTIGKLENKISQLEQEHSKNLRKQGIVLLCIENNIHHPSQLLNNADLQQMDEKHVYVTPPDHVLVKMMKYKMFQLELGLNEARFETPVFTKTSVDNIIREITELNIFTTNTLVD